MGCGARTAGGCGGVGVGAGGVILGGSSINFCMGFIWGFVADGGAMV